MVNARQSTVFILVFAVFVSDSMCRSDGRFPFPFGKRVRDFLRGQLPDTPTPSPEDPPPTLEDPPPAPTNPSPSPPLSPSPPQSSPPSSPPGLDCSSIPNCATCFPSGEAGGGIKCSSCNTGFAACPSGTVCSACNTIPGCIECTCAQPGNVITCTKCDSNRALDTDNGMPQAWPPVLGSPPSCPLCLDFIAGCTACIDADADAPVTTADGITCTDCGPGFTLDVSENMCDQ